VIDIFTSSEHSYSIEIGSEMLSSWSDLVRKKLKTDTIFILIDENVWQYHKQTLGPWFESLATVHTIHIVPSGERSKSLKELSSIYDFLLGNGVKRSSTILVIGGGVLGDVGGFAAASTLRGVSFIQIPTTLLAMVDSSVGGKTGINHSTGKNLIGAFYQPDGVFVDTHFLTTLPHKEWLSGMGEVIKYAAIKKPDLFDRVFTLLADGVNPSSTEWIPIITECVSIKAEIVRADEFELGIRAYLNFGHTFAHAMEAAMDYKELLHGEAVFMGMIAATHLSNSFGANLDVNRLVRFKKYLDPVWPAPCMDFDKLVNLMGNDKKNTTEGITFVILDSWGNPRKQTVTSRDVILKALSSAVDDIT